VNETQFFVLPDDRKLCYVEYGDPMGVPFLYCHGFPSSRLEAQLAQSEARRVGIRLISIDRPGFGQSDYLSNRSINSWPEDVAALVSHLRIEKFSVIGVSGGAPYAISCAARLQDNVSKLGIVCGLAWLGESTLVDRMRKPLKLLIKFFATFPQAGNKLVQQLLVPILKYNPAFVFSMIKSQASKDDKILLSDPRVGGVIQESLKEAFHQGSKGPARELVLYQKPWEFDLKRISAETYIWHGDNDHTVPLAMGQHYAEIIPNAQIKIYPGEGHFSVPIRHIGEILQTLCAGKP
jgi:pimeloyl-ACP methyl ester carboxylesterase